jgi:hypothetical protein
MVSADGSLDSLRDLLLSRKPSPERDADVRQRITHRVVLAARRTHQPWRAWLRFTQTSWLDRD